MPPRATEPTGRAVRVLAQPYPSPSVVTLTVDKPECGKIGVHFRWDGGRADPVSIVDIAKTSPLMHSAITVGRMVLSVNGVAATTSVQVAGLIHEAQSQVTLSTTDIGETSGLRPYCKIVSKPRWDHHPGLNFDATRGRGLVQVSRVFANGPFHRSALQEGDVVLAVNEIPVSKPQEAEMALRDSGDRPYTLIYAVDMKQYRESILQELQALPKYRNVRLSQQGSETSATKLLMTWKVSHASVAVAHALVVDRQTQHLVDQGPVDTQDRRNHRNSTAFVQSFLERYNQGMERRMLILEEAVCVEAWKAQNSCVSGTSKNNSTATGAAAASGDEPLRSRSNTSQSNTSIDAQQAVLSMDDDTRHASLPLATSLVELLPVN